jgi:1,4-alpha-glucan branching enzyme
MSQSNDAQAHRVMGALPCEDGVGFRVWAPHAKKVYVTGTFNN